MKKQYQKPFVELIEFNNNDFLVTSGEQPEHGHGHAWGYDNGNHHGHGKGHNPHDNP